MPQSLVQFVAAIIILHGFATEAQSQTLASGSRNASRVAPADASARTGERSTHARRRSASIRIDGVIDPAEWAGTEVTSGFVQSSPQPGAAASQTSHARVQFDDQSLYIALRLDDSAPDSIVAPLARRDFNGYSDWAHVIIDSYQDKRTAFRFGLNPAGVKRDSYISGDNEFSEDLGWDAVWEGATRRDATGWTAEFRIPLSQLRFDASAGRSEWGIQFARDLARSAERSSWALVTPALGGFVSRFGTLTGIEPPERLQRVELMPFTLGSLARATGARQSLPSARPRKS